MTTVDHLLFVQAPPLRPDDVAVASHATTCLGGKGLVAAVAAAGRSRPVALLSLGDKSTARHASASLSALSIAARFVVCQRSPTETWLVCGPGHSVRTVVHRPAVDETPKVTAEIRRSVTALLRNSAHLLITTEHSAVLQELQSLVGTFSGGVAINLNTPLLMDQRISDATLIDLLTRADVVIMNAREHREARGRLGARHLARALRRPILVETDGSAGGRYRTRDGLWAAYRARSVPAVVCTVGAGDTFAGEFVRRLLVDGQSVSRAIEHATIRASEKVQRGVSTVVDLP